jgi:hypothetical protein
MLAFAYLPLIVNTVAINMYNFSAGNCSPECLIFLQIVVTRTLARRHLSNNHLSDALRSFQMLVDLL